MKFDVKLPNDLAPVYNSRGEHVATAPYQELAYSNYLCGVELGLWGEPATYDKTGVDALKTQVQSRPFTRFLEAVSRAPKASIANTERLLQERAGVSVKLDRADPHSRLFFWFADELYGITSDAKILFGLRGNQSNMGTACLQPTGNGYRSLMPNGLPLSPEANGLQEMRQEFGLKGSSATALGMDFTITTLQFYNMSAEHGAARLPGVVPCFKTSLSHRFDRTAEQLLTGSDLKLNHENLGVFALDFNQLERLAAGQRITAQCFVSRAPEAQALFKMAFGATKPGVPLLHTLREVATGPDAPHIEKNKSYCVDMTRPRMVTLAEPDLRILDSNYLADALNAFQNSGHGLSASSRAYIAREGHLKPMPQPGLNQALGSPAPARLKKAGLVG